MLHLQQLPARHCCAFFCPFQPPRCSVRQAILLAAAPTAPSPSVRHTLACAAAPAAPSIRSRAAPTVTSGNGCGGDELAPGEEFDVVVIGAGIGGLSCAALLAYYGFKVVVCESHSAPGGAAHCWTRHTHKGDCHFDSGTALFFGLPTTLASTTLLTGNQSGSILGAVAGGTATASAVANDGSAAPAAAPVASGGPSDNPPAALLLLLDEPLEVIEYGPERTCLVFPEGAVKAQIGSTLFPGVVRQLWGSTAEQEWLVLQGLCRSLAGIAVALHPLVVRHDPGVVLTAALRQPLRFIKFMANKPALLQDQLSAAAIFIIIDVLCWGTCGVPATAISAAYMVRAFTEMYQPGTQLQWPCRGPQSIADALVRGLRKHGGKLLLRTHVASVLAGPSGRAAGVLLRTQGSAGETQATVRARKGGVSNASIWDTRNLVPQSAVLPEFQQLVTQTPPSDSFVHLHAVVDLPAALYPPQQLPVHSYFLDPELVGAGGQWPTLTISSAIDDSLAPAGQQVLHMYMAEPFKPWEGLDRTSPGYQQLKEQRAGVLWQLIDQVLPGAHQYVDWQMVGTPLTHQRFRRRYHGAYGPSTSSSAGNTSSPQAVLAMKGLWCCGDCTFPFIGTPAVAASGMWVANTFASVAKHWAAINTAERLQSGRL